MTTIKIKNGKKLPKTEFESIEELLDWAVDYFQDEKPLSADTIKKAEIARNEISSVNSTFRIVV